MKNIVVVNLCLLLSLISVSCKVDVLEIIEEEQVKTVFEKIFLELKVNHQFDVPKEFLIDRLNNPKESLKYFESILALNDDSKPLDVSLVTLALEEVLVFFPDFSDQEAWFSLVKSHFPELSHVTILENIEIIEAYYEANIDYLVLEKIKNKVRVPRSQKILITLNEVPSLTQITPIKCMLSNVVRNKGFSVALTLYGLNKSKVADEDELVQFNKHSRGSDDKHDAWRHMYWSGLLANNYYSISLNKRVIFAESVGDANESCGSNKISASAMDIHNNTIGRSLWSSVSDVKDFNIFGVKILFGVDLPTNRELMDMCLSKLSNAVQVKRDVPVIIPQAEMVKGTTYVYKNVNEVYNRVKYLSSDNIYSYYWNYNSLEEQRFQKSGDTAFYLSAKEGVDAPFIVVDEESSVWFINKYDHNTTLYLLD